MATLSNLTMLNAIIASCKKEPFVADDLYRLGYTQVAIEKTVVVAPGETVVPDLAIASSNLNSVCCFEAKSGRNLEAAQGHRYERIEPEHIERFYQFSLKYRAGITVDVSYLCPEDAECIDGLTYDLERESLPFPLVSIGAAIGLVQGRFKHHDLQALFSAGMAVEIEKVPKYYRFDQDSFLYQIAPFVVQTLVAFSQQGVGPTTTQAIAADAYGPYWSVTGPRQRNGIVTKIGKVLKAAMLKELKGFLQGPEPDKKVTPNTTWTLNFANTSGSAYPAQRLASLKAAGEELTERMKLVELGGIPGISGFLFED